MGNSGGSQSKYGGGLEGVWNSLTSSTARVLDSGANLSENISGGWGNALIYGGVIVVGGTLLMLGYSFMSGKQSIAEVARAVKPI